MTVEETVTLKDKTIFKIYEPTRYGREDVFREVEVPHDPDYRSKLQLIAKERIENPPNNKYDVETIQTFDVPSIGTVIFINIFDTDTHSATYRQGSHQTNGPYIIKK